MNSWSWMCPSLFSCVQTYHHVAELISSYTEDWDTVGHVLSQMDTRHRTVVRGGFYVVRGGSRWFEVVRGGLRWFVVVCGGSRWFEVV
jgi:hypothetical protein